MNEELNYAEMLEIPVETVTVKRKERRRRPAQQQDAELSNKLVEQVNDRMEEADDPAYAESREIEREGKPVEKKSKLARRLIIGEFVAVCALCLTIFLTNIFMSNSAINTFVRGLFQGETAAAADERTYTDFKLSPVINDYTEAELTVSDTGVLSFTAKCSVYAPCEGKLASVNGDTETGMTVELKHSDTFSTIISGLDAVYYGEGDSVKSNVPLGYSDGESSIRVMFYSDGTLLNCYTLGEGEIAWS